MANLLEEVRFYCSRQEKQRLRQEAALRKCTLSKCARDILAAHFKVREQMEGLASDPGQAGDAHSGVIHTVMATTEQRLAATLDRQSLHLARLSNNMELITAMLDRAVLSLLIHLPEVNHEIEKGAVASGTRRYERWQHAVLAVLESGGAVLSDQAEQEGSDSHERS